jgi:hypothetical protein
VVSNESKIEGFENEEKNPWNYKGKEEGSTWCEQHETVTASAQQILSHTIQTITNNLHFFHHFSLPESSRFRGPKE